MNILRYLLGHKGKGSLMSYLRKKLWATELSVWYKHDMGYNNLYSFFDISIRLTENGFNHLDDVMAAVFSYIKFLRHSKLNDSMFFEVRRAIANLNRFFCEFNDLDNVKYLTDKMIQFPLQFVVTSADYFFNYDADAVKKTIDYMNLRKFNIMITLKRSKSKQLIYKSIEPWFGIKYMEMDMPTKWIELHQTAEPFPEFSLPEKNRFITHNFTILSTDGDASSEPFKLLDYSYCVLWFRQDKNISRPYAEFTFSFMKPHAETSIDK